MANRSKRRLAPLQSISSIMFHPRYWPRWVRRTFLLTLPAAMVCWVVLGVMLIAGTIFRAWGDSLYKFWNAPRRHRHNYAQYGYGRLPKNSSKWVNLNDTAPNPAVTKTLMAGE